jgi:hypothetical protein
MGLHETLSVLPDLHTVDDHLTPNTRAVWVFTPDSSLDWLVWEYDPISGMAFGLCDMGQGSPEIGSVVMTQRDVGYEDDDVVDKLRGGYGLPVEVDKTINTIAKGYRHKALTAPEGLFT